MSEQIIQDIQDGKKLLAILDDSRKLSSLVAGMLSSNKTELTMSAVRLIGGSLRFKLFHQLGRELNHYIQKGEIKANFCESPRDEASLYELLKFIDEEAPDQERFRAMRSIFIVSLSQHTPETDRTLAYEFFKIGRELDSGELMVLKAAYDIYKGRTAVTEPFTHNLAVWHNNIAKQIGHNISSLVDLHENKLVDLKLIAEKRHSDRSGIGCHDTCRLTNFGQKFCEFITKYDAEIES